MSKDRYLQYLNGGYSHLFNERFQFQPGDQPSASMFTNWAQQDAYAIDSIEALVGDLRNESQIGRTYFTNLIRSIGNLALVNSWLPTQKNDARSDFETFNVSYNLEVAKNSCIQNLPFLPYGNVTLVTDGVTGTRRDSIINLTGTADFCVDGNYLITKTPLDTGVTSSVSYEAYAVSRFDLDGSDQVMIPNLAQCISLDPTGSPALNMLTVNAVQISPIDGYMEYKITFPQIDKLLYLGTGSDKTKFKIFDMVYGAKALDYKLPDWILGDVETTNSKVVDFGGVTETLLPYGTVFLWNVELDQPAAYIGEAQDSGTQGFQFYLTPDGASYRRTELLLRIPNGQKLVLDFDEDGIPRYLELLDTDTKHFALILKGTDLAREIFGLKEIGRQDGNQNSPVPLYAHGFREGTGSTGAIVNVLNNSFDSAPTYADGVTGRRYYTSNLSGNLHPQYLERGGYQASGYTGATGPTGPIGPSDCNALLGDLVILQPSTLSSTTPIKTFQFLAESGIGRFYEAIIGYQALWNNTTGSYNIANGYRALYTNTWGSYNIASGYKALYSNTWGYQNIALGHQALYTNTTGLRNIANGYLTLYSNTTGSYNIGLGQESLYSNTTGSCNIALGYMTLNYNTYGNSNIALGGGSLFKNTTGSNNIANGYQALYLNTTGSDNIALGYAVLYSNTTGVSNIALGYGSLLSNTYGNQNIALGIYSLFSNQTGSSNIAIGQSGLYSNTTGDQNIGIGEAVLYTNSFGRQNIGIGYLILNLNTTGSFNIGMGDYALGCNTTGSYNIGIGERGLFSNTYGNYNTALGRKALYSNITGSNNIALGQDTLYHNIYGNYNIALGIYSLYTNTTGNYNIGIGPSSLYSNITGSNNIALGRDTLYHNIYGDYNIALGKESLHKSTNGYNIALGYQTLYNDTSGMQNIAIGNSGLWNNTIGNQNIAIGNESLLGNTTGEYNIGIGYGSLYTNATGEYNIGIGYMAGFGNTYGKENIGIGHHALYLNTYGHYNVALGYWSLHNSQYGDENIGIGGSALFSNTDGNNNIGIGSLTLPTNTSGDQNIAIGSWALLNNTAGNYNTAIGYQTLPSNTTGNYNIAIGYQAGFTSFPTGDFSNSTCLGKDSDSNGTDTVRIGGPTVDVYGHTWTNDSDLRDKVDIRDTILGLDFINMLHPIDYKWDLRLDYRQSPPVFYGNKIKYQEDLMVWRESNRLENLIRDGSKKHKRYHHGFIAQEIKSLIDSLGIDFGGYKDNKINGGPDKLALTYTELIAPIVKAIQELSTKIDKIEQRLDKLE